jgi:hypothetical protein
MKAGTKLKSTVSDTEVMVIRGAAAVVECGGRSMLEERPARDFRGPAAHLRLRQP